jgi:predicted aspartyl protease
MFHAGKPCKFKDAECFYCKKLGHIAKACHKKQRDSRGGQRPDKRVNQMTGEDENWREGGVEPQQRQEPSIRTLGSSPGSPTGQIFTIHDGGEDPRNLALKVPIKVGGRRMKVDHDTGADETVMSKVQWDSLGLRDIQLESPTTRLTSYSGNALDIEGVAKVSVEIGGRICEVSIFIINGEGPALLGKSWLASFGREFVFQQLQRASAIGAILSETSSPALRKLLSQFGNSFASETDAEVNRLSIPPVTLYMNEKTAIPKFCRARPIPLALQNIFKEEIQGMVEKQTHMVTYYLGATVYV